MPRFGSFVVPCALLALGVTVSAQTKLPPTPAEYGQWETLVEGGGGRGGPGAANLSPDGKWLAYGINRSNGNNELRVANIAAGTTRIAAFGTQQAYSDDSRWLAFSIGYSETQQDRMRRNSQPVENKLGLLDLAKGEQTTIDAIQSFSFSPNGQWIAMRHYPPETAGDGAGRGAAAAGGGRGGRGGRGGGANGADDNAPGATLIVRELATGRDMTFGNVSEFAWQDIQHKGTLLAIAISTPDKTGNGIQLFDTRSGTIRVLDSSNSTYSNLAWRKDSADLAALQSKSDDKKDGPTHILLAWRHLGESSEDRRAYDPAADPKFPTGLRTVTFRRPSWADDARTVYVGLAEWYAKPPSAAGRGAGRGAAGNAEESADDQPDVDIWHWRDAEVMAHQVKNAAQNGRRSMLAAWHPDSNTLVQLAHSETTEQVTPFKHRNLAWAADWKEYALERSIGRPEADISLVDPATGQHTKIKDRLKEDHYLQVSPGGRYLLYLEKDHYWTVDVNTRAAVDITKNVNTSFIDTESDETVEQKPPFGVAGWTRDDAAVILYDKFDLWKVPSDGSKATRLTNGSADQVRYRYVRLDPEEEFIDLDKPAYLSLFGIWSKMSGYAVLRPGAAAQTLMLADKSIERLAKASEAPVYSYVSETAEESPNVFVGTADLKDAKRVTDTNPFQSKYAWTRSELVEYKNSAGRRLQGALYYPAGYEPGKKYPMVVYMYEKLSDGLHRYNAPSERSYYSASAFTSHGYFLLQPDIVFQKREPGLSVADCVTAAVKAVVAKGAVDEKKVGIVGHSWGGFDTSFLATHTHIFAAAVSGAPITDLISNYGNHHWSSGIAETDHIETGQQRMEVPLYEDLQAYIRNSAVFAVSTMTTPLMIEVGDADGTVFYHQGIELYNIARRARKNVVLLVYGGEDHGLRKKPDQIDYQRRIFTWFGHYLKDEPAAPWIVNGDSYLDHQREKRTAAAPAATPSTGGAQN
jgi:dipeptidyl aminopeptidase/acylaminoacyl peptidase